MIKCQHKWAKMNKKITTSWYVYEELTCNICGDAFVEVASLKRRDGRMRIRNIVNYK